jgi:hypothetical protein
MSVSRTSYDKTKNYEEVQFNEDVSLLDSELNELQKIIRDHLEDTRRVLLGKSVQGDDWLVMASGNPNSITVKAGIFWHLGRRIRLLSDVTVAFLSTPVVNRTDCVFVEFSQTEIDATEDPNILDPQVGAETSQRIKLQYAIRVVEGSSVPTPTAGTEYFQIARLNRIGGDPSITSAMIQDDRANTMHTYVVKGCAVTAGVGLNVVIGLGQARIAKTDYFIENTQPVLVIPPSSTGYVIMRGENPEFVTSRPFDFHVPLAVVTSSSSAVTAVTDYREWEPLGGGGGNQGSVITPPDPNTDNPQQVTAAFSSFQCAASINKYKAVYLTNVANTVNLADNTLSGTTPAIGLATTNYATGNIGTFLKMGQMTNPGWNWVLNKAIFLGTNGDLTQTPPTAPNTIIQKVAWPVTATTIEWSPSLQTIRN